MKRILPGLLIIASLVLPKHTLAAGPGNQAHVRVPFLASDGTTFSAEDLTGPATTAVMDVRGFTWITFYVSVAAVSGTASVTSVCSTGPSSSDVNYPIQSEALSLGVATFYDYTPTKSVTTSDKYPVTFNIVNKGYLQCVFTSTDGTVDASAYAW